MIAGGVCQGLESLKGTFKIYIGIEPPARKCGCTALHRTLQKYKQNVPVTFSGKGVGIRSKTLDNRLPITVQGDCSDDQPVAGPCQPTENPNGYNGG
eukprot:1146340-Pelagomonas_calceolata.AAC.1